MNEPEHQTQAIDPHTGQRPKHEERQAPEVVELYKKREKIYPRSVTGLFARYRKIGVGTLLGLFYLICWIEVDGQQVLLFDLPARQFHIFGFTFWPQDFFYLTVLLIIAALGLFFVTALFGRVWCGFACPQTVYTEFFLWVERRIEGDRGRQIKLDKEPWGPRKFRIKASKHAVWILFSLWTGFTFVGYFTPIRELGERILGAGELGGWEAWWIFFYGFATYGNAGWMREQVCLYMCPYARFQSAMFDQDTLVIAYDEKRGESRGARKRGTDPREKGLGDCVNCTLCVQVCPTGIDIRDGLQYQCIGCAACVDVCDQVMLKMNYPKGLISYTTERVLEDGGERPRLTRPKVIVYACIMLALLGGLVVAVANRVPVELDIIRDRHALYRTTNIGLIENVYTLKIFNMDKDAQDYRLSVSGIDGMELIGDASFSIEGSGSLTHIVNVRIDPVLLKKTSNTIYFSLQSTSDPDIAQTEEARFLGPARR